MPGLGFWPLFEYPRRCDEIISAVGSVVNSPNVNKGITAHAININLGSYNSYIENFKTRALEKLKTFHTSSKEHYNHNK